MPFKFLLTPDEVTRLVERDLPFRVIDVRGRAAYRRSPERVDGDLRPHGVGMMNLINGLPRDTWLLLYCT